MSEKSLPYLFQNGELLKGDPHLIASGQEAINLATEGIKKFNPKEPLSDDRFLQLLRDKKEVEKQIRDILHEFTKKYPGMEIHEIHLTENFVQMEAKSVTVVCKL